MNRVLVFILSALMLAAGSGCFWQYDRGEGLQRDRENHGNYGYGPQERARFGEREGQGSR